MTNLSESITSDSTPPEETFITIPHYLQATYWWAYIHPQAVRVFERQWLVNLILWGNYKRLCDAVLHSYGSQFTGRMLQIACAYGNLTPRLAENMGEGAALEVIDILPIQIENLARKISHNGSVKLHCMDSTELKFPAQHFDRALLFFLLHEQPLEIRKQTLAEAIRVIRPEGTLTIVDYAGPSWFNPMRYVMAPILTILEPFARDLWKEEVTSWIPQNANITLMSKQKFFGGLYQMLTLKIS